MARRLPGMAPAFTRIDLYRTSDGWTVSLRSADAPGFVVGQEALVYDDLTGEEALDVVAAICDGLGLEAEL